MRVFVLAFAIALSAPAGAPQLKLPPVDQCAGEPGFRAFRTALVQARLRRDGDALLRLLARDVVINFGGDHGRAAFATHWALSAKAPSPVWKELDVILRLGCAKVGDALVMPSLAGQFSGEGDQDAFEKVIVVSSAAPLRRTRKPDSARVATVAWNVVTAIEAPDDLQMKVRLPDGREGWLWQREVRSPLDYRMVAERRGGRWLITAFVAGD